MKAGASLCLLALLPAPLLASVPPVLRYRTADGLPTNQVTHLLHDHLGFLWVGTGDGLARFDGDRFETFGTKDGLPAAGVTGLVETRKGTLFVATSGGVAELMDDPTGGAPPFAPVAVTPETTDVHGIALAPDDSLLIATHHGLYTLAQTPRRWRPVQPAIPARPGLSPSCLFVSVDSRGRIWAQCADLLLRIGLDGHLLSWPIEELPFVGPGMWVFQANDDPLGRTWLAGSGFLVRLVDDPVAGQPIVARDYEGCFASRNLRFYTLRRTRDGRFWAGGNGGPVAIDMEDPGGRCPFTPLFPDGIQDEDTAVALAEDDQGNLWFSDGWKGLGRLAARGFTFYDRDDGLRIPEVESIAETKEGEICLGPQIQCLHDGRFSPPGDIPNTGWGNGQRFLVDRDGRFWVGTRDGLLQQSADGRWNRVGPDGLPVMRLFEDRSGQIWFGPDRQPGEPLCRYTRASRSVRCFGSPDGIPGEATLARAMTEDAAGGVWVGFREGQLLRFRAGRFRRFGPADGFEAEEVYALLPGSGDTLWVAAPRKGVYRVEDASTERPRFFLFDGSAGLSSLDMRTLVADAQGHVYVGSTRGIDRLDPTMGHVRRYTERDGLLNTYVTTSLRATDGSLWFGTARGVAHLNPRVDEPKRAPPVYLMGLRVAGEGRPLPPRGIARLQDVALSASQRNLEVRFTAISNRPGERLRFQTLLSPMQSTWSEPSEARSVSLAGLAPGAYRFQVRAVSADGASSDAPAAVAFSVAAPVWMRGWFLALAAAALAGLVAVFHRQRTARLVALERQRMRLAMDLHDDVGSSLSQIALQSEVALARLERGHEVPAGTLERISGQAREVVDAMGDVVWSVDPSRDDLADLARRMRAFALDAVGAADVRLDLALPAPETSAPMNANLRRQLYLVFKEALSNALRHAHATHLAVVLAREGGALRLTVEDDGVGGAAACAGLGGHGLGSMRRRAGLCGGELTIEDLPHGGTRVTLRAPFKVELPYARPSIRS